MKSHLIDELLELIENTDSVNEAHIQINEYLDSFLYHPLQDEWRGMTNSEQRDVVFLLKYPNRVDEMKEILK